MLRKTHIRRPVAVALMLLGAALLFLASETAMGISLFVLGVLIEALGIAFRHQE